MKKTKPVKGTVSMEVVTLKDGKTVTTVDCAKVIKQYVKWGETPKYWSDARAAELAFVCEMVLDMQKSHAKLKKKLADLEETERSKTKVRVRELTG